MPQREGVIPTTLPAWGKVSDYRVALSPALSAAGLCMP